MPLSFHAGVAIPHHLHYSALPGTRAPKGNFEMPTKFTVWNDARKVTNETSFVSAPPGPQPRTPSRPGPQRMGPSSASRMRFDPSVSSVSTCGSGTSCLPAVALQRREAKRLGLEAPGPGRRQWGREEGRWLQPSGWQDSLSLQEMPGQCRLGCPFGTPGVSKREGRGL